MNETVKEWLAEWLRCVQLDPAQHAFSMFAAGCVAGVMGFVLGAILL